MYEPLLEGCGLTQNESRTYLALLKLGKARSSEIVRGAKISGGKVYETLYKLIDKGLVSEVSEHGVKHFSANDPQSLILYLQEQRESLATKEKEIEKNLAQISSLKNTQVNSENVSLIKGLRGITPIVYAALEYAEHIQIMGIRSSKEEKYNTFWRNWHLKRVELKKSAQILFSDKKTDYWNFFKKLKHTQVKELSSLSPSAIMIIDQQAFLFSYDEDLSCIQMVSPSAAKSLSNFFDELWRTA